MASLLLLKGRGKRERQGGGEMAGEEGKEDPEKEGRRRTKEEGGDRKACGPSGSSLPTSSLLSRFPRSSQVPRCS